MKKYIALLLVLAVFAGSLYTWSTVTASRTGTGTSGRKASGKNDTTSWYDIGRTSKVCNLWYRFGVKGTGLPACSLRIELRHTNDSLYQKITLHALADSSVSDSLLVYRILPDSMNVSSFRTLFFSLKDTMRNFQYIEER